MVLKCIDYIGLNSMVPVMIKLYKENGGYDWNNGKIQYYFTKFGYLVELDATNISINFLNVWQV